MAKKAAPDEQPYRPLLDVHLVNAAISHTPSFPAPSSPTYQPSSAKVLELPRNDTLRNSQRQLTGEEQPTFESPTRISELDRPREMGDSLVKRLDQEKRILFSRSECQDLDRLVVSLAARVNTSVRLSHVFRALTSLLLHAEGEIDKRAGERGHLTRPPNGDANAIEEFERELSRIIANGIRDAGPIR
jgi:hypothetical protein